MTFSYAKCEHDHLSNTGSLLLYKLFISFCIIPSSGSIVIRQLSVIVTTINKNPIQSKKRVVYDTLALAYSLHVDLQATLSTSILSCIELSSRTWYRKSR